MVHSSEISCLSHIFIETIVANPTSILRTWRRFLFPKGSSTKTSLTFYTGITKREISACIHNLFFSLCKVLFLTSFSREYCEQLEMHFGTLGEVYLKSIPILKNLYHFLHIYHRLRYTSISLDPKFAEVLGKNARRKDAVSDWDASSSTKSCYQIRISLLCHHKSIELVPNRFISFECPLFKFYYCSTVRNICIPILIFFQDILVYN